MQNNISRFIARLPTHGRALDLIKIFAAAIMVVDHYNVIVLGSKSIDLYLFGRIAFPLFCYAAACAVLRAGQGKATQYAIKLLILALFVAPISQLTRDQEALNILFTLAAGLALIPWLDKQSRMVRVCIFYGAFLLTPLTPQWEFGYLGVLLPSTLYFMLSGKSGYTLWAFAVMAFVNFTGIADYTGTLTSVAIVDLFVILPLVTMFGPLAVVLLARDCAGDKRLLSKYFLHAFYPAHMIILYILAHVIKA